MELEWNNLTIKYFFVSENPIELNALLNDFNSLDYKYQQISNTASIVQLIESLSKINTNSDSNIKIKAFHLIKQLISKQKVILPEAVSNKIIKWIIQCNKSNSNEIFACEALDVLALLFKKNSAAVLQVSSNFLLKNHF